MRTETAKRAAACVLSLLLAGCVGWQVKAPSGCNAGSILTSAERIETMSPKEADAVYAAAKLAFQRTGSGYDRLRLALLLSHPDAKLHRDDAQALRLAQEYVDKGGAKPEDLTALARYLISTVEARQELDAHYRVTNKKLADERSRADDLGRKLEELKALEKLLDERQRK